MASIGYPPSAPLQALQFHLSLPTEFEPERQTTTSIGCDRRVKDGELLFPGLFPAAGIAEAKTILGAQGYAAQHQERPAPAEGGIFKRHWWRFWQPPGSNLPAIRFRDGEGVEHEAVIVNLPHIVEEWPNPGTLPSRI
jgi:hypothetical protein